MSGDEVLQAVLLADCFSRELAHATTPAALLPLVGVPIIDYALETLALSGVNETFLFCTSHPELIKKHIQKAEEDKAAWCSRMTLKIIISETCRSPGDALRDLDAKGLIRGYFILLGADTISNVELIPLLEKHKELCKTDKNAAMTLIYKNANPGHRAQCATDNIMLVSNVNNNRILQYQKVQRNRDRNISFPLDIFIGHSEVVLHSDLIESNIAMCSPSVLPLFSDNFDFQTIDDFIKGILMNEELLASTIYFHQLTGQYASRVTNWKMYQTVSQDIMHRWVFPLVPDMGISKQQQTYMLLRNYVYRHKDVTLERDCVLEEDVVISEGSSIGKSTTITSSVIGKNCTIGADCEIIDSYIMDGCVINSGCIVNASVLSTKNILGENVNVNNVITSPDVELDAKVQVKDCFIQSSDPSSASSQKLGKKAYTLIIDNDMDNESISSDVSQDVVKESLINLVSNWWEEKSEDGYVSSSDESSSSIAESIQEDENIFLQEVVDSLVRGYDEQLKCDNLILEINSSRYAYNMSLEEVNLNVVRAIFSLSQMKTTEKEVVTAFKKLFKYFKPIFKNYIKDPSSMLHCLRSIEGSCKENESVDKSIGKILVVLYDQDILSEDVILKWFNNLVNDDNDLSKNKSLTMFINWLEEASEESDDS